MKRDFRQIVSYMIVVAIMALMIGMTSSCDNVHEPVTPTSSIDSAWDGDTLKAHYVMRLEDAGVSSVTHKTKKLPQNRTYKVTFKGGTSKQHAHTQRWFKHVEQYINLSFEFTGGPWQSGDIRIGFDPRQGAYSYVGSDIFSSSIKGRVTMNLGWSEKTGRVVMHELLHSLGFLHEQVNYNNPITWNTAVVIADMKKSGWSEAQTRSNILNVAHESYADATAFDKYSIMLYYFPMSWIRGNHPGAGRNNTELSDGDIRRLKQMYPKSKTDDGIVDDGDGEPVPVVCPDLRSLREAMDVRLEKIGHRRNEMKRLAQEILDINDMINTDIEWLEAINNQIHCN